MVEQERVRWAAALSFTGWMFVLAFFGYFVSQVRRSFAIGQGSFEDGKWWQRVEQISFAALPQNLMILVPAAAAAAIGTVLVRDIVDRTALTMALLVRIIAGLCYLVIAVGTLGIVGIFFRNPDNVGDLAALLLRLGGVAMSVAMLRLCLEAERTG